MEQRTDSKLDGQGKDSRLHCQWALKPYTQVSWPIVGMLGYWLSRTELFQFKTYKVSVLCLFWSLAEAETHTLDSWNTVGLLFMGTGENIFVIVGWSQAWFSPLSWSAPSPWWALIMICELCCENGTSLCKMGTMGICWDTFQFASLVITIWKVTIFLTLASIVCLLSQVSLVKWWLFKFAFSIIYFISC